MADRGERGGSSPRPRWPSNGSPSPAGGTVVDDSNAPSLTVIADQDGNKGILCVDASAATKD